MAGTVAHQSDLSDVHLSLAAGRVEGAAWAATESDRTGGEERHWPASV